MTYLVNEKCIKCKLMDCVEVCPVDCFYEGKNMLVIKPDECIDCGVCEPECPIDAIVSDTEPGSEKWLELNKKYSEIWPNINEKKDPPTDHEKFKNENDKFEKDKANGMVPVNKQSHLRPLATINQVNKCISILKSKPKIKRSMWSRRAQEYEAKISSGKIYELAEVVRDLNKGDDLMIDQSYSERQLFEKAYDRLLTEFQIVMGTNLEDTQKKLDKALKRNLEKQIQKAVEAKAPTEDLPEESLETE